MYRYRSHHSRATAPGAFLFGKAELSSPQVQALLAEVAEGQASVTCLCQGEPGLPMVTHLRALRHLRRESNSGTQHLPGCLHHDVDASSLGMAPRGLWSEGAELVIDLDRLLGLDDERVEGGSVGGSRQSKEYTSPLHGLLWLLLLRAGLNVDHVNHGARRPWAELQEAARTIRLTGESGSAESLQRHILLPRWATEAQSAENQAMLERHLKGRRRLLFAGLLQPDDCGTARETSFCRMGRTLGVSVNIDHEILVRAFRRCPDANECVRLNQPVLALGTVKATRYRTKKGAEAISGWVAQLTLLSVQADRLVPTPASLRERYMASMSAGDVFVAKPSDDPLMRVPRTS